MACEPRLTGGSGTAGERPRHEIPVDNIRDVTLVREEVFRKRNVFMVLLPDRELYLQVCVGILKTALLLFSLFSNARNVFSVLWYCAFSVIHGVE